MTWIRRRIEGSFPIPSLTLEGLLTTPLEQLGLETDPDGDWLFRSRPYQLLGWTIQPILHCSAERYGHGMTLHCHRIKIRGLGELAGWVHANGAVTVTSDQDGLVVLHWLELGVQTTGALSLMPRSLLDQMVMKGLKLSSQRLGRAVKRQLIRALSPK